MTVLPDAEDNLVVKSPAQRLCNEIQLFDLCDLERCTFKADRFCTNNDLLKSFELIADAEMVPTEVFSSEELEEGDDFDEDFEDDGYGEEAEYEDD